MTPRFVTFDRASMPHLLPGDALTHLARILSEEFEVVLEQRDGPFGHTFQRHVCGYALGSPRREQSQLSLVAINIHRISKKPITLYNLCLDEEHDGPTDRIFAYYCEIR